MTHQPAPDARPSSLHKRLTVALANAADRARLAELVAGDLGAVQVGTSSPLVRSEDLWLAADRYAQDRAEDRRALRARLDAVAARAMHDADTAQHQLEHLQTWQRTILEGAGWATQLEADLPGHLAAVQAVRDALDERRAEQRTAQQDLEKVLEQRMAATAAIEEADRELREVSGSGMDESELRRELEAAGQALRDVEAAHAAALARLEELQLEATGLRVRREALEPRRPGADGGVEPPEVAAVRMALAEVQAVSIAGEVDVDALALADAWRDLNADLRQVVGPQQSATEVELDAARRRVSEAVALLAEIDAATAGTTLSAAERAALDAAHAEVLAAEEQVMGRRRVGAAARARLEAAHQAERALLDRHGFAGYLDVVLSGGRTPASDPRREAAEREHFEATLSLDALERSTQTSPELRHLRSERARLLKMAIELLGVDPGEDVEPLLRTHRPMPAELQRSLSEALAAADVRPVGRSLEDAATEYLAAHPLPEADPEPPALQEDERRIELAAIDARAAALEGELVTAQADVERTGDELQLSQRSVETFEGELTVRAGEDMQRMKRFAAAEQLRAQIDAVAATLRRAEESARADLEAADQAVAAAEVAFEQSADDMSELARKARKLAEELPIDDRPEGDPLRTLPVLVTNLRAHAAVLQPEIDKAEAAVVTASAHVEEATAACRLASAGGDGPQPEDLVEGLEDLLESRDAPDLLVLDEAFVGVDEPARSDLLEIVRRASVDRQIVLLTEDPEVLGWAIELPADEATAIPADALLARLRRSNHGLNPAAATADAAANASPSAEATTSEVDITTPTTIDPEQEATPTARRWAGQR